MFGEVLTLYVVFESKETYKIDVFFYTPSIYGVFESKETYKTDRFFFYASSIYLFIYFIQF